MMSTTLQSVHIAEEQIPAAGEILAEAFFGDPLCVYTQPDLEARLSQFAWLFTQLVREGDMQRGAYTNTRMDQPDGVAVWMLPQAGEPSVEGAVWSEMDQMEQRLGSEAYHRFTDAYRHFEDIHHQCTAGPHWYLALLGVSPRCQRQGLGNALLTPVLQQADQEGLPCYLETFVSSNVPFYEHRGFQVVEAGVEPQSQVPYWAMKREPMRRSNGLLDLVARSLLAALPGTGIPLA
jgi:GNAT superfamily N-acetyltransferase